MKGKRRTRLLVWFYQHTLAHGAKYAGEHPACRIREITGQTGRCTTIACELGVISALVAVHQCDYYDGRKAPGT